MSPFSNVLLKTLWAIFAVFITLDSFGTKVACDNGGALLYPRGPSESSSEVYFCRTPSGGSGECIIVSRCRQLWNNRDYRLLRKSLCGFMGDVPKVCCPRSTSRKTTLPTTTNSPFIALNSFDSTLTTKAERARVPLIALSPKPDNTTTSETNPEMSDPKSEFTVSTPRSARIPGTTARGNIRPLFLPEECGKNKVTFRRIVGGQESVVGTWPWMAAIYLTRRGIKSAECGGAIISEKYIITAAHCIVNSRRGTTLSPKVISVRVGDHDLESDDDGAQPVEVAVKSVIKHESFDIRTFQNDIALIELSSPVQFVNHVAPICLPFEEALQGDNLANRNAFAAGWGTTSFNGPASSKLQEVQLRIWQNNNCEERFKKEVPITSVNLCAGDGDKDSCRGDSGGPLMLPHMDGRFYMIGVVSFGKKCAEPGYPGVYTRVSEFLEWIEKKVKQNLSQ